MFFTLDKKLENQENQRKLNENSRKKKQQCRAAPGIARQTSSSLISGLLSSRNLLNTLGEKSGFVKILGGSCSTTSVLPSIKSFLGRSSVIGGQMVAHSDNNYKNYTNMNIFPLFLKHSPSGTSLASAMHYAELAAQDPKI